MYVEKFIESVNYRNELFPKEEPLNIEIYKSYQQKSMISNELNEVREICLDFSAEFFTKFPNNSRLCCNHNSELLKRRLLNDYNDNEISVTIGDVSYRGKLLHNLDKEKLRSIIKKGKALHERLDVHVWITYKSIYVFDPTIKFNVNISDKNDPEYNLLLWNENNKQEFDFHPLLVDNKFHSRVDEFKEQFLDFMRHGGFSWSH